MRGSYRIFRGRRSVTLVREGVWNSHRFHISTFTRDKGKNSVLETNTGLRTKRQVTALRAKIDIMYRPNSLWTWMFIIIVLVQAIVALGCEGYDGIAPR